MEERTSPTPRCSSYWKESLQVPLTKVTNLPRVSRIRQKINLWVFLLTQIHILLIKNKNKNIKQYKKKQQKTKKPFPPNPPYQKYPKQNKTKKKQTKKKQTNKNKTKQNKE